MVKMVKVLNCCLEVNRLELKSLCHIPFPTNILRKGKDPLILSSYGLNSITAVILEG